MRPLFLLIFKWMGWKTKGVFPTDVPKYIVAVAPHTSSWDFVIGVLARSVLGVKHAKFIGKSSLFRAPFGWFFKWAGGYPIDRSGYHDVTDQITDLFNCHEKFALCMAPEGTRKKVDKLRTGFYYIARKANVPIVPVGFDFAKKTVVVRAPFYTTNNFESDMEELMKFYRTIEGRNPALGFD